MTDRMMVYPGAVGLETDLLSAERFAMIGLGFLTQAAFGTATLVDGLACAPVTSSLSVTVGPGSILQQTSIDATAFSSLSSASELVMKLGINIDPTTISFTPPATTGQSQCFLIEAQFLESDTVPVVLNYYNSAAPTVPFSGPGNAGTTNNTQRVQRVSLQTKAGIAANTGSQVAPSADSGWIPLYVVTLANGATSVVTGNIAVAFGAPFIVNKIPNIRPNPGLVSYLTPGTSTWTVPQGVTWIKVRARGAGGGGGGSTGSNSSGGGGGGGGWGMGIFAVQPGQIITSFCGLGGTGGPSGVAGNGGSGSTVTNTTTGVTLINAGGGGAGGGGSGGTGSPGSAGTVTISGTATGSESHPGDGGGIGYAAGGSIIVTGVGGSTFMFQNHNQAVSVAATGLSGGFPGLGGNGGVLAGSVGGAGANGEIYIEFG